MKPQMLVRKPSIKLSPLAVAIVAAVPYVGNAVAENAFVLEEVVVTAQKRSQSAQDVPIALSAFSGDSLKAQGMQDITSLITQTPGLSGKANDSFLNNVSIRGIATNDFGLGGDLSMGVFRNGVHSGRNGEVINSFYDIERVEVLKGPQGLLFGRSASTGAFHVITKKPSVDEGLSGSVSIGGGQRGQGRADAAINLPLSDNLAMRVAAYHSEEDGFVKNTVGGSDLGGHDKDAFRLSALYSTDEMDITLVLEQENAEQASAIYTLLDPATRKPVTGSGIRSDASDIGDDAISESDVLNLSLQIDYETDLGTFTSITGARKHQFDYREEVDGVAIPFLDFVQDQDGEYFSQEFRLVSNDEEGLRWFAGVSVFHDRVEADFDLTSVAFGGLSDTGRGESDTEGAAIYGDLTYDWSDRLRTSLGIRYSYDKREYTSESTAAEIQALLPFVTPNGALSTEESWTSLTPRLLVEYDLGEETMIYASVTKGFKPGGFDSYGITNPVLDPILFAGVPTANSEVASFDQEEILSYELGAKGYLPDDWGSYAISAYYYDYTDLQQQIPNPAGIGLVVTNVGEAEGMGLEAEVTINLTENLRLMANAAWSDTEITDIDPAACDGLTVCEGKRLPNSADFTASANLMANFVISDMDMFASVEVSYSDGYDTDTQNKESTRVDDWTEVNLRAGAYLTESWRVSMFLENATDEKYFTNYYDLSTTGIPGLGVNGIGASRPRTFGFDATYSF